MYDLIVIGAGPAGIALAVEGIASGIDPSGILLLEKSSRHNATIRQLYPEHKLTTANYKGFAARCEGHLCITDMTKGDTLAYFDRVIAERGVHIQYGAEVFAMRRLDGASGARFRVEASSGACETRVLAVAIGIFGRPAKPTEYRLPGTLRGRILFDLSERIEDEHVLVVGGGDTAAEYAECLHRAGNRVVLSYRGAALHRPTERNRAMIRALAARGDVRLLLGSNIDRLEDDDGRPRAVFREVQYPARTFDHVVYALGGATPSRVLKALGVACGEHGPIVSEHGESDVPGLFVVGDLVVGRAGGSINTALNSSVAAMRRIARTYLRSRIADAALVPATA
jgi:thioredoxin reductase (NADPH)